MTNRHNSQRGGHCPKRFSSGNRYVILSIFFLCNPYCAAIKQEQRAREVKRSGFNAAYVAARHILFVSEGGERVRSVCMDVTRATRSTQCSRAGATRFRILPGSGAVVPIHDNLALDFRELVPGESFVYLDERDSSVAQRPSLSEYSTDLASVRLTYADGGVIRLERRAFGNAFGYRVDTEAQSQTRHQESGKTQTFKSIPTLSIQSEMLEVFVCLRETTCYGPASRLLLIGDAPSAGSNKRKQIYLYRTPGPEKGPTFSPLG